MKKDLIFIPIMLVIAVLLFLLRVTGITAHIAVSVAGLLVLAVYTAVARKQWKSPALEILMRVFYAIALITGIVMMNVRGVAALGVVHKASAGVFVLLLIVLLVFKLPKK